MPNRSGLKKVTKTVRGKKGMVKRSYWVRGKQAVGGAVRKVGNFVNRHHRKFLGAAALVGGAALAYKHRNSISHGASLIKQAHEEGKRISRRERLRTGHPDRAAQGHDTSEVAVRKAGRAGYMKGVMNSELGKRYQNWRGAPMTDAQGRVHGRVKRI